MKHLKYCIFSLMLLLGLSFARYVDNDNSEKKISSNIENHDSIDSDMDIWIAFDDDDSDDDADDDDSDDEADDDDSDDEDCDNSGEGNCDDEDGDHEDDHSDDDVDDDEADDEDCDNSGEGNCDDEDGDHDDDHSDDEDDASDDNQECVTDADCAEGEACIEGDCEDGPDTECVTDEDCAEGEACLEGDCEDSNGGDDDSVPAASLTFGEIDMDAGTVEVRLNSNEMVAGFQFVLSSDDAAFVVTGASGGLCEEFGLDVFVGGGSNVILGFSELGNTLPTGNGVLTNLTFIGVGDSEVCISESIVSGSDGVAFDIDEEGCLDFLSLRNGDMNNDGNTNVLDVVQLISIILSNENPTDGELWLGDMNDDNVINVLDIIVIVNNILGENLGRTTPVTQSTVEVGNGIIQISADGDIAGIQLDAVGSINLISNNLPKGFLVKSLNRKVVIVNLEGVQFQEEIRLDYAGNLELSSVLVAGWNGEGVSAEINSLPDNFKVNAAFPNPFNPETQISFTLPFSTDVKVQVFNMQGQKVAELANGNFKQGRHSVKWIAEEAVSGMYFLRINAGGISQSQKVMLLK